MKLIIENIGSITQVEVDLGNLTVIAGENDVGKSTVGRVFFALVQAFSNYPAAIKKIKDRRILNILRNILNTLRRDVDISQYPQLRKLFSLNGLQLMQDLDTHLAPLDSALDQLATEVTFPVKSIETIRNRLLELRREAGEVGSEISAIADAIFRALRSEFTGEIINKDRNDNAKILLIDGATTILQIEFNATGVVAFKGGDPLGIEDATLVEGPAILQYRNVLDSFNEIGERQFTSGSIPFHAIDLTRKLQNAQYDLQEIRTPLPISFDKLYEGKVGYDEDARDFVLKRGQHKISSNNTATGIKALAILELLIKGEYVRDDTILILDEPETSLHPKWQIAYAKIICALAAQGCRVLVTTHSPYMLEALKGYSKPIEISKFYLAQRDANSAIRYYDTAGDISPIIRALSQPLEDLIDDISHDF